MQKILIIVIAALSISSAYERDCLNAYWYRMIDSSIKLDSVYFYEINYGVTNDWGWKYTYENKQLKSLISDSYDGEGPETTLVYSSINDIPTNGLALYQKVTSDGDTLIYDTREYLNGSQQSITKTKMSSSIVISKAELTDFVYTDTLLFRNDSIIVIDHSTYRDSTIYEYIVKTTDLICNVYNEKNEVKDSIILKNNVPGFAYIIEEGQDPRRYNFYIEDSQTIMNGPIKKKFNINPYKLMKRYDLNGRYLHK